MSLGRVVPMFHVFDVVLNLPHEVFDAAIRNGFGRLQAPSQFLKETKVVERGRLFEAFPDGNSQPYGRLVCCNSTWRPMNRSLAAS